MNRQDAKDAEKRGEKKTPLGLVFLIGAAAIAPATTRGESERPSVVFIRTDDQARWAVGFNGNPEIHTPNMDRLHREGAGFTQAFVTTPVCSPSRVALMTGLHGVQAGVTDWIRPEDKEHGLNPDYLTWPEVLQQAGYVTGHIGKWHLGTTPRFHPTRHGFHYFMGLLWGGTPPTGPELEIYGVTRKLPGVYAGDFLTDDALHFIRQNRNVPFLLMLDFREPHAPYGPVSAADGAWYQAERLTIPNWPGIDAEQCRRVTRDYYAAVSSVDRNLGRVLDLLDELKLARDTIVIFTSDHGYMIGHHGLWHKGNATTFPSAPPNFDEKSWKDPQRRRPNMFDDSIRVPLAIRWPAKIRAGTVVDAAVLQTDFYPTILKLVGVAAPELPKEQPLQGRDFSPLLLGEKIAWRDHFFGDYDMSDGKRARMRMIRTGDWKLVKHYEEEGGEDELYDLRRDPGETKNLFALPPSLSVLDDLERRLVEWQRRINDPLLSSEEFRRRQARWLQLSAP